MPVCPGHILLLYAVVCFGALAHASQDIIHSLFGSARAILLPFTYDEHRRIYPRQTSTAPLPPVIPAQCRAPCGASLPFIGSCTPEQCCTLTFENDYFNCVKCVGAASLITDYAPPQQQLDNLFVACAGQGQPITKLTLPGQDPNRVIPVASNGPTQLPATVMPTVSSSRTAQSSTTVPATAGSASSPSAGVSSSPTRTAVTENTPNMPNQVPQTISAPANAGRRSADIVGLMVVLIATVAGWHVVLRL